MRAWGRGLEEVTLDEIYVELIRMAALEAGTAEALQRIELECERHAIRALDSGKRLFRRALESGKPVIIVSDTYLAESFIGEMARREGYVEARTSSCPRSSARRRRKALSTRSCSTVSGALRGRLLHVGDDHHSDVTPALGKGLRSLFVPTAKYRWRCVTARRQAERGPCHGVAARGAERAAGADARGRSPVDPGERRPLQRLAPLLRLRRVARRADSHGGLRARLLRGPGRPRRQAVLRPRARARPASRSSPATCTCRVAPSTRASSTRRPRPLGGCSRAAGGAFRSRRRSAVSLSRPRPVATPSRGIGSPVRRWR